MNVSKTYRCLKLAITDLEHVMHWRMLPHVTRFMNTDPVLTLDGQKKWFEKISSAEWMYYWIVHVDDVPCGVVSLTNIDLTNKRCTWGYYIAEKNLRSLNLAISLEMSLYDYVFDKMALNKITGESFCLNIAAVKIHELCGCKTEGIMRQHILKKGQYYDVCIQSMFAEKWKKIRNDFEYQHIEFTD